MRFIFAIQLISVLLMFLSDASQLICDRTDWVSSLDKRGWSKCSKDNTYLVGLRRNDTVSRIGYGICCTANTSRLQPATCVNANWLNRLESFHVWALCPNGYFLNGFHFSSRPPTYLLHINDAQCCHPQNLPNDYGDCYDEDVSDSFNDWGWSACYRGGYYMTGFYKSSCDEFYCVEKLKCCNMKEVRVGGGWSDCGYWGECSAGICGNATCSE